MGEHEKPGLGPPGYLCLNPLSQGATPAPSPKPWTRYSQSLVLLGSPQGPLSNLQGSFWKKLAFNTTQQGRIASHCVQSS